MDTHAHLTSLEVPAQVVSEAVAAGVDRIIAVGVDGADNLRCIALAEAHPEVFAAAGHHPMNRTAPDLSALKRMLRNPRVVAVGEVGIDMLGPDREPEAVQRRWLDGLCGLALEAGLPVSVHTRESAAPTLEVLAGHPGLRGVMHYFSLEWEWAERFLALGFHLSFSGLITRPSRGGLREVVRRCPPDRLLLETDSPYGSPHGRVKEPNRPAWMVETARLVAELRGVSLSEVTRLERDNAEALFTRLLPA